MSIMVTITIIIIVAIMIDKMAISNLPYTDYQFLNPEFIFK